MDLISISSVVTASSCPLRLYLERGTPRAESPRYTVCKQVSYHLGDGLDAGAIWKEVRAVAPLIEPAMQVFLEGCVQRCRERNWPVPTETDLAVSSETLGIRGVVDKIFTDEPYFALTRSSEAPAAGAYASDRLRVAAYTACLRETLDLPAEGGYVEYIPSGVLRLCIPQPRDRRRLVRGIQAARRVESGEIPKKPLNAPCNTCPHADPCAGGVRRLSDLI